MSLAVFAVACGVAYAAVLVPIMVWCVRWMPGGRTATTGGRLMDERLVLAASNLRAVEDDTTDLMLAIKIARALATVSTDRLHDASVDLRDLRARVAQHRVDLAYVREVWDDPVIGPLEDPPPADRLDAIEPGIDDLRDRARTLDRTLAAPVGPSGR